MRSRGFIFFPRADKEGTMLVLTRRHGEEIVIAGNIHVTVLSVQGDRVRLGITAPRSITVDRQEVHERRFEAVATCQTEAAISG
jgi:carbon storage regulator